MVFMMDSVVKKLKRNKNTIKTPTLRKRVFKLLKDWYRTAQNSTSPRVSNYFGFEKKIQNLERNFTYVCNFHTVAPDRMVPYSLLYVESVLIELFLFIDIKAKLIVACRI